LLQSTRRGSKGVCIYPLLALCGFSAANRTQKQEQAYLIPNWCSSFLKSSSAASLPSIGLRTFPGFFWGHTFSHVGTGQQPRLQHLNIPDTTIFENNTARRRTVQILPIAPIHISVRLQHHTYHNHGRSNRPACSQIYWLQAPCATTRPRNSHRSHRSHFSDQILITLRARSRAS
jgi:hypothetical protein